MNRKESEWLMGVLSAEVFMFDLIPWIPDGVKLWVSLIIGSFVLGLFVVGIMSYTRSNKLARILLLPSIADINYTDETDKCGFCIDTKYLLLSNDINSHIRDTLNENIQIYNTQAEAFIKELNLKLKALVIQKKLDEWDINNSPEQPMRYYTKRIYFEIGDYVRYCNKNQYPTRNYCINLHHTEDGVHRWILYHVSGLVASDSETEIIEIQNTITEMFDNAVKDVRFKKLNTLFEQIKKEHEIEIKKIVGNLKHGIWFKE